MMTAVKASSARNLNPARGKTVRNGMETGKKRNSLLLSENGAEPWKVLAPLGSFPRYREPQNGKPKILQKVTLQHTLPHPPMSFSSDTEDRAS